MRKMRVNLLEPGSWVEVNEALVLSGIAPRDSLKASIRWIRVRIQKYKKARVAREYVKELERGLKILTSLDEKLSVGDKRQVFLYERKLGGEKDN